MVAIISEELLTLYMRINTNKSTCIKIGPRFNITPSPKILCDKPWFWATEMKYVGHTIMAGKKVSFDHHPAKAKFFGATNSILSKIGTKSPLPKVVTLLAVC